MRYALPLAILFAGCFARPTAEQLANADYGPTPSDPEAIVRLYIKENFKDPESVRDLEVGLPQRYYYGRGSTVYYGYRIRYSCNAKNSYGGYTGKQAHYLFVSHGQTADITDVVNYYEQRR